jgi:HlyD family secretion protein
MSILKKPLVIGLIVIASIVGFTLFSENGTVDTPGESDIKYKEVSVERGTFRIIVTATGEVKPIDRIEIKSKASGQIEELPVEEGDLIQEGELIARLDQKDERAEVAQAQADRDIAKAELEQAQRMFDRRDQLFQDNLISEEERDQIDLSLAVARGILVQANTLLDRAKERLSESIVRAPIDGVILQKYVEKDQIIASGVSNVGGGTPIVDIADMSSVHIEAGIDEIDIGKVQIGQYATVVAEAYPQFPFNGEVVRISPEAIIEQNVTLFEIIIEVENSDRRLKSGMNTNIEIEIIRKENVLMAPVIALQGSKGIKKQDSMGTVLLKRGDEFVHHQIEVGLSNFKQLEIMSGLTEGDILGVPMMSRLKDENDRRENRLRDTRSFGASSRQTSH